MRILIVEDDTLVSRMYDKVFGFEGFEVTVVDNGVDGLKTAKTLAPDLILLDVMMPKMNGLDVLDALKQDVSTKDIPVVMLTNLSGTQDAQTAIQKGALEYLIKSQYKPRDVVEKIKQILSNREASAQSQAQAPPTSSTQQNKSQDDTN